MSKWSQNAEISLNSKLNSDSIVFYLICQDEEDITNLPGAVSENWVFLHSANDRLYPISVDMESKLPVAEMISTGIFVLDVGIKGTPKTYRDRETDRRDLFAAIESSDIEKVCYCFIIFSYLLSFEHILYAQSTF